MLTAICKSVEDTDYWAYDDTIEDVLEDIVYVTDSEHCAGEHECVASALDPKGNDWYTDSLQTNEMMLSDDEPFVVTYYVYDGSGSFDERVDFAITKNDIINNVLTNKYVEGAYYWTFGQMLKTTNDWLNGEYGEYGD